MSARNFVPQHLFKSSTKIRLEKCVQQWVDDAGHVAQGCKPLQVAIKIFDVNFHIHQQHHHVPWQPTDGEHSGHRCKYGANSTPLFVCLKAAAVASQKHGLFLSTLAGYNP